MTAAQLDSELENLIGAADFKVPGLGVIVYVDGAEVYSKFLGKRIIGENEKPVTRATRFRAASVSKGFTSFAVMRLAERGKINLDEDVSEYLGFSLRNPFQPSERITARMLAAHTSSLRDGKIYSSPPDVSIAEFFKADGKFFEGGAHFARGGVGKFFSYSNLNYGLLGTIIEAVTGERFDIHQKKNILRELDTAADYIPANLERQAFENLGTLYQQGIGKADDFNGIQPPHDTLALQNPYDENFQAVYDLKSYRAGTNATIFSPQGGLRISFEELAHALEMLMNGGNFRGRQILRRESVAEMLKPHWVYNSGNGDTYGGAILNYGLGFYRIDGKSSARVCKNPEMDLIGHTGEAFGMLSGIFFRPNTRTGFVYMMNGTALDIAQGKGIFSANYIWEENLMNAVCNFIADSAGKRTPST